ncbi:putative ABC transport system permease protein [Streptomyces sp. Ag109_O5-1]|uniref:FtsX-like permease family protein n=1 Tax=Streptomyces sp. Ag109_O5-1 TaxID=1938851 RepID=UPI000F4FF546|nr:FtsX-like permease family protein [Streptomyces sp. Ag109_O5-1]RPE41014.1 putative ABC transport system permease protein [Streptomyces sp. Ag109_O5-1]
MLSIAAATLRHRLMGFVGAFLALALGTTMIGMMTLTLAATFGTPHPGPQRFKEASTAVTPQGFEGRPMKAPAVLPADVVTKVTAAGKATADRSFPVRLSIGSGATTGHPWTSAAFAGYHLLAGRAPRAADEIVVAGGTKSLTGRRIEAVTADGAGPYRVVGVTDALWFENAVFFSSAEAERLSPGVNALVTDQSASRVSTLVGGRALVLSGDDLKRIDPDDTGGAEALANAQAMAGSTTGLAVCVAVFVVIATFAFATEQRRRELALLRLVGAAPRQVRRMVLGEAMLIGLAAAAVGCVLAPLCTVPLRSWMLDHDVAPSWFTIPFNPLPLLISFVVGVAAALAGSAATLVRVSLIRPIEVLRESVVERRGMTPIRWLLGIGMLIGAVVAGIVISRTSPYLAASARRYEAVPLLYVGAVTLLAPILLRPVTRLLTGPLRGSAKAGPLLVRENILTSRRRTAATVAPIVVAVGLVGALLTMQKSGDAAVLVRQRQEIQAADVVVPGGSGIDARTLERLTAVPGVRVTPVASMNIRIGTAKGEQIDSLTTDAVPATALGSTVTPPLVSGSLASPPENFLVIDEHAAQSDDLSAGDHVITLLPTGEKVPTVIAAVVARGLTGDDTYVSASLTGAVPPNQVYLDSTAGAGRPLDEQRTAAVNRALAGSDARLLTHDAYLEAQHEHAARQTNNAAVVILGIALAYALIAVANTLIMAMAGRRREFALLGLAGAVRGQILKVAAAEAAVAVVVGTVLAAVATALAAVSQHVSLSRLVTDAPTVIPWAQVLGTVALCAVVTVVTASGATGRETRRRAIDVAGIRE